MCCIIVHADGIPKDSILVPTLEVYGVIAALTILATGMSLFFIVFSIWYRKERLVIPDATLYTQILLLCPCLKRVDLLCLNVIATIITLEA